MKSEEPLHGQSETNPFQDTGQIGQEAGDAASEGPISGPAQSTRSRSVVNVFLLIWLAIVSALGSVLFGLLATMICGAMFRFDSQMQLVAIAVGWLVGLGSFSTCMVAVLNLARHRVRR